MLTNRVLFVSLSAILVGAGFMAPAFSQQSEGDATTSGAHPSSMPSYCPTRSYSQGNFDLQHFSDSPRAIGYPCTWSGSRDLAQGVVAYRHGAYSDAISQWKTAASKDCAAAAYKLGMLYYGGLHYGGKSRVSADRSLGAAWLRLAAESKTVNSPYYQLMSQQAVAQLSKPQHARYVADYAELSGTLGSSIAR